MPLVPTSGSVIVTLPYSPSVVLVMKSAVPSMSVSLSSTWIFLGVFFAVKSKSSIRERRVVDSIDGDADGRGGFAATRIGDVVIEAVAAVVVGVRGVDEVISPGSSGVALSLNSTVLLSG